MEMDKPDQLAMEQRDKGRSLLLKISRHLLNQHKISAQKINTSICGVGHYEWGFVPINQSIVDEYNLLAMSREAVDKLTRGLVLNQADSLLEQELEKYKTK